MLRDQVIEDCSPKSSLHGIEITNGRNLLHPHRYHVACCTIPPPETSSVEGSEGGLWQSAAWSFPATLVLGGCVQSANEESTGRQSGALAAVPRTAPFPVDPAPPATAVASHEHAVAKQGPESPEPVASSEDVVRAWFAALDAFLEAGYDGDWKSPGLAATAVQPELGDEESELRWYASAGLVTVGTPQVEGMEVNELTRSLAAVVACVGGIEFVKPSRVSNASLDNSPTTEQELQIIVIDTSTGWRVKSETKVGSQCQSE